MAPRRTERVRKPSQRAISSPIPASQALNAATAAAGLLALRGIARGRVRRSKSRSQAPRRRGSLTTASDSGSGEAPRGVAGELDEDDEVDTELSIEHNESN